MSIGLSTFPRAQPDNQVTILWNDTHEIPVAVQSGLSKLGLAPSLIRTLGEELGKDLTRRLSHRVDLNVSGPLLVAVFYGDFADHLEDAASVYPLN